MENYHSSAIYNCYATCMQQTLYSYDLKDGLLLIQLLQQLTGKPVVHYNQEPRNEWQEKENISQAFQFMQREGLDLVSIGEWKITDKHLHSNLCYYGISDMINSMITMTSVIK